MLKFLSNRYTLFDIPVPSDHKMCEYYAGILEENEMGSGKHANKTLLRQNKSHHEFHGQGSNIFSKRETYKAISNNRLGKYGKLSDQDKDHSRFRSKLVSGTGIDYNLIPHYFINLQHMRHFSKAFPHIFLRLRDGKIVDINSYELEAFRFYNSIILKETRSPLEELLGCSVLEYMG